MSVYIEDSGFPVHLLLVVLRGMKVHWLVKIVNLKKVDNTVKGACLLYSPVQLLIVSW